LPPPPPPCPEPEFAEFWELTELFKNAEILKKGAEAPFSFLKNFRQFRLETTNLMEVYYEN
jgi:hypothetical protein